MAPDARPALPAALKDLKEVTAGPGSDVRTFCVLHGAQPGPSCVACDEHFPQQVKLRTVEGPQSVPTQDVQAMIDAAVKAAVKEHMAFIAWKESDEGKAAAAAAKTAGVSPPDHATPTASEKPKRVVRKK